MDTPNYLAVINRDAVRLGINAASKDEVFQYAANLLYEAGTLSSRQEFVKDLYEREALGATGIGGGVAIPHGKSKAVKDTCIAILKLQEPLDWETTDGKPVRVLIMFAVSEEDRTNYALKLMSQVARKLAREGVCDQLTAATTAEELINALA